MSRHLVETQERTYLLSPDDQPPQERRSWALVRMQVIDELTGQTPTAIMTVDAEGTGFTLRVNRDGLVGLTGIPQQVFPSDVVPVTIRAEGYLPRTHLVPVRQVPPSPADPSPLSTIAMTLHREPTIITGRTVRANGNSNVPLAGATVSITGLSRTAPPAHMVVAPDPPNIVSLQPPLYAERVGTGQSLRQQNLVPVAGNDKTLMGDLLPGTNPIRLSDRLGLAAGDVLRIDHEHPDLAEFIAIKSVPTTAPADQVTSVTLEYPPIYAHRQGTSVQPVTSQPPGANQQFVVDALVGDTCVFLDSLAGLMAAQEVKIFGPSGPDEYHKLIQFSVVSDADGYYRLPPLSRVAQLELHAEKTVGAQTFKSTIVFQPDYRQRENLLDFLLKM